MRYLSYSRYGFLRWAVFSASLVVIVSITLTVAAPSGAVRFAAIGDYGLAGPGEQQVAALIESWNVDFIITQGDNNYEAGAAGTIDRNIGQYYQAYIGDYTGSYGPGSDINRFFPALGNHDWRTVNEADPPLPYVHLDYFTLPGNERYYRYTKGPVEFFVLDSDYREPDGITFNSVQGQWLKNALADSTAVWKIVYMHHSPYSSEQSSPYNGSRPLLQWPYDTWGADAVISAHDHVYQRLKAGDIPYFVNGLGGKDWRDLGPALPETRFQYTGNYGAMLITADAETITFEFYSVENGGTLIDTYELRKNGTSTNVVSVQVGSSSDDAEEEIASGVMDIVSSDLELVDEISTNQTVGMRFTGVSIPQGAIITDAYIQFAVDEASATAANLTVTGEASDDAATFSNTAYNISSRPKTEKQISWTPVEWTDVDSAGVHQRTPDISPIIQEIIDRPGWEQGQSLAIMINGSGERIAKSYDGDKVGAPLLYVKYNQPQPVNEPPVLSAIPDQSGLANALMTFSVIATDPDGPAPLVLTTSNLPAGASFEDNGDGSGLFSWMPTDENAGEHVITFIVNDKDGLSDEKLVNVTVILDDHGNTCETATVIEPNSVTPGTIQVGGDVDYVMVVVPGSGQLSTSTNGEIDVKGTLKDSSGTVLATDDNSGIQNNFSISHPVTAGTYCIRVESNNEMTEGSYGELASSFVPSATGDITVSDSSAPPDDLQVLFGDVTRKTFSDHVVTVRNTGNANLDIGNIADDKSLFEPFSIVEDTCSRQTVLPDGSCTFIIRFEPTTAGTFRGVLDIPSSDLDDTSISIKVSGNGVAQSAVAKINVTGSAIPVGELQVLFGDVAERVSSDQTVMIANDGEANLVIGDIAQVNSLEAPFEILTDSCSTQVLAPAEKCAVVVRFMPMSAGETFEDDFDVPSSDLNERTLTIRVKGTGVNNSSDTGSSTSGGGGGSLNPLYVVLLSMLFLLRMAGRSKRKQPLFYSKGL